jgi:hypothetical protein
VSSSGVEVVALAVHLGHAHVHVRGSPEHDSRFVGGEPQATLVVAHRVAETPLRDSQVGQADGAPDHVGAAPGPT